MAYVDVRENQRSPSYRVKYRPQPGAPEKVQTFDNRKTAEQWCELVNLVGPDEALRHLKPANAAEHRPTVADVLASHIGALSGVEPGTRQDYLRDARRDIAPHLGEIAVADLTRRHVSEWINTLQAREKPLAAKTVKNRHALLSAALTTAVQDDHLIPTNVARGVKLPEVDDVEMVFLEPAEVSLILDQLDAFWHPFVIFLVGTGLRFGEATALRVQDVDRGSGALRVKQAWKHQPGTRRVGRTKTRAGLRTVKYDASVAAILKPLLDRPGDALVFLNRIGRPVLNNSFHSRQWQPAIASAIADKDRPLTKKPRVHDLRHTFASWALNDGVPIFVLSRVLGHKHASVTTDRYGHLQPDRLDLVAAAAETRLSQIARR